MVDGWLWVGVVGVVLSADCALEGAVVLRLWEMWLCCVYRDMTDLRSGCFES
jgi:hypothetical protein